MKSAPDIHRNLSHALRWSFYWVKIDIKKKVVNNMLVCWWDNFSKVIFLFPPLHLKGVLLVYIQETVYKMLNLFSWAKASSKCDFRQHSQRFINPFEGESRTLAPFAQFRLHGFMSVKEPLQTLANWQMLLKGQCEILSYAHVASLTEFRHLSCGVHLSSSWLGLKWFPSDSSGELLEKSCFCVNNWTILANNNHGD